MAGGYTLDMSTEEILEAALALSLDDRAKVARELIASLDGAADADAESAWTVEIARRMADIDAGRVQLVSREEVESRVAARLQRIKSR
jgi:putative addiction module component (TIGR02574 family)